MYLLVVEAVMKLAELVVDILHTMLEVVGIPMECMRLRARHTHFGLVRTALEALEQMCEHTAQVEWVEIRPLNHMRQRSLPG